MRSRIARQWAMQRDASMLVRSSACCACVRLCTWILCIWRMVPAVVGRPPYWGRQPAVWKWKETAAAPRRLHQCCLLPLEHQRAPRTAPARKRNTKPTTQTYIRGLTTPWYFCLLQALARVCKLLFINNSLGLFFSASPVLTYLAPLPKNTASIISVLVQVFYLIFTFYDSAAGIFYIYLIVMRILSSCYISF